jgi:adenosylmethionine-8-amino-7-oxononanoate aminotransferase
MRTLAGRSSHPRPPELCTRAVRVQSRTDNKVPSGHKGKTVDSSGSQALCLRLSRQMVTVKRDASVVNASSSHLISSKMPVIPHIPVNPSYSSHQNVDSFAVFALSSTKSKIPTLKFRPEREPSRTDGPEAASAVAKMGLSLQKNNSTFCPLRALGMSRPLGLWTRRDASVLKGELFSSTFQNVDSGISHLFSPKTPAIPAFSPNPTWLSLQKNNFHPPFQKNVDSPSPVQISDWTGWAMSLRRKLVHKLAELDHKHVWHPFTQMKEWLGREPIVIVRGKGSLLWDVRGREYIDANSSIWTNLHGHNHPQINSAIKVQLAKIAHSSALGLASEPASLLGQKLIQEAAAGLSKSNKPKLAKVFYSDDGSTAVEVALKLSYEYWRRRGIKRPRFLSLDNGYHGDTVGAVSVGHIDLFHKAYKGLLFKSDKVAAPYCYRCPHNKAKPERADARTYAKCKLECVALVEKKFNRARKEGRPYTGFVVEPLIQGAAGMIAQPQGWLRKVSEIARVENGHLIADEVLTGFGRATVPTPDRNSLFACASEGVTPDFMALAKGMTGGYLPMAATLTSKEVFEAFLGEYREFKTFFHGHSYTGNQLGAAAALANLEILDSPKSRAQRIELFHSLKRGLQSLWAIPRVGDIRQVGLIAGVELVKDWRTREPFTLEERAGIRVCEAMAKRGVLTRAIGNVVVVMPPFCTTKSQVARIISALGEGIEEKLG